MIDVGTPRAPRAVSITAALPAYTEAVRQGARDEATRVALGLVERGASAEQVVVDLLAPAQVLVGEGWARGGWSISVEHRATAITESVLLAVCEAQRTTPSAVPEGSQGHLVVACAEGEWHTLPGRMASEVLRLRGAAVTFLAPSVPAGDLADFLGADAPTAVALTCSTPMRLASASRSINALRAIGSTVVCGGRGFGPEGRWAWALGADLWAGDISSGADLLLAAAQRPAPAPRGPGGDPSADAELRLLRRNHERLVNAATSSALRWYPALSDDDAAMRATREDLGYTLLIVESATAVHDPTVATDFVTWFEDVLAARALPVGLVARAFDSLLDVLPTDVRRARAMALTGRAACVRA